MILNKFSLTISSRIICSNSAFTSVLHAKPVLGLSNTNTCHNYSSLTRSVGSELKGNNLDKQQFFSQHIRKMSSSDEVLFEEKDCKGIMILNRPKALNALNENMVRLMIDKLTEWQGDKKLILLKGMGDKAFCAGGDVVSITKDKAGDPKKNDFFKLEYTLDNIIGTYKVPFVSLITGIVMGGGCGISINGKYRVASEKSMFAMPETVIGLFPDVGGSHFLPKLGGGLGMFLALTGHRLKGWDLVRSGLATHYCPKDKLEELQAALLSLPSSLEDKHVKALLDTFNVSEGEFSLTPHLKDISECFTAPTLKEVFSRLKQNDSEFCRKQLAVLETVSPTSLVITFEELKRGSQLSLQECLKMEFRMVNGIFQDNDFFEGVRARLVDKDNKPKWQPASLSKVNEKETIEKYFSKLPQDEELQL